MAKYLFTGFSLFGNHRFNPSQALVENLNWADSEGKVLEVSYLEVHSFLSQLQKQESIPEAIISLGLCSSKEEILLEELAYNYRGAKPPDSRFCSPIPGKICDHTKSSIKTCFDTVGLERYLTNRGFSIRRSEHAGTYLCNYIYFKLLKKFSMRSKILFIHLPQTHEGGGQVSLDTLTKMLHEVRNFLENTL